VRLSIVIPTLSGREESLARCLAAYGETTSVEHEIVVIKDRPTWPHACNEGYEQSVGEIVHFSADDLEPLPGWHDEILPWMDSHDELPAPRVYNYSVSEENWDNRFDGDDHALTAPFTRIPIMRRDQWERIGRWPEYNYVADIWVSEKGRTMGIETRIFYSYAFVHHWSQVGRKSDARTMARAVLILRDLRREMV